jgi:capsular polysaccharide biosynthesis protein
VSNNIKKIYKNLVKLFFYFLYGSIEINNNLKLIEKIKIKNKYFGNNRYSIYKIKDGVTFTDNTQNVAAISNNKLHVEPSFQHGNDKIISPKFNPVLKRGLINFRKKYDGTVLSLVQGASTENYFHWLMDILPKIKIYSSRYLVKKVDYFYLPNLTSSQKQSLQYLGIQSKKIINSSLYKHISAKKIFFVSHPWYTKGKFHDQSHKLPKWQINWIRTTFIKFRKKFKISKNIYIDRSESKHSHCQIINHT